MTKKVFKKIGDIFLLPFKEHFLFFILLCALTISGHVLGYFYGNGELNQNAAIAVVMHCISLSYLVTLLISVIRSRIVRQIIQTVFILFAAFDFVLNFYCTVQLHYMFDADIALLMLETNPNEAREFFSSMVPTWMLFAITGIFLLLLLFGWLINHHKLKLNLGKKTALLALGLIGICIAGNLYRWGVWTFGPIGPFYQLTQHDNPSDLNDYFSHPKLTFDEKNKLPENVVLIIGESFTRCHSSLYGYDKLTNPHFTALKDSSLLFAFDSIDAPAPQTTMSLRYMLSTYSLSDEKKEKKWYEYISIIEMMKESGFDCYWFGNQACVSKHNGISRIFAQACDRQWMLQTEGMIDAYDTRYDIVLVDSSYQFINQLNQKKNHNFFIYHMMGSHFDYSKRYPKEFAKFSKNDYLSEPQNHREILAIYDNSLYYNDYVVSRIMDLFKDNESIVIYIPDHGQVMYRDPSNPDYYSHGTGNPVAHDLGVEIPFFVYASPSFQQKYPQIMERIKYRQGNPKEWNSDDLPYLIMDLIGVKTINGEDIHTRSVLN